MRLHSLLALSALTLASCRSLPHAERGPMEGATVRYYMIADT